MPDAAVENTSQLGEKEQVLEPASSTAASSTTEMSAGTTPACSTTEMSAGSPGNSETQTSEIGDSQTQSLLSQGQCDLFISNPQLTSYLSLCSRAKHNSIVI